MRLFKTLALALALFLAVGVLATAPMKALAEDFSYNQKMLATNFEQTGMPFYGLARIHNKEGFGATSFQNGAAFAYINNGTLVQCQSKPDKDGQVSIALFSVPVGFISQEHLDFNLDYVSEDIQWGTPVVDTPLMADTFESSEQNGTLKKGEHAHALALVNALKDGQWYYLLETPNFFGFANLEVVALGDSAND